MTDEQAWADIVAGWNESPVGDVPEAESLAEGGPPAWGPSPLYTIGGVENSGSAEDTSGIIEGD